MNYSGLEEEKVAERWARPVPGGIGGNQKRPPTPQQPMEEVSHMIGVVDVGGGLRGVYGSRGL